MSKIIYMKPSTSEKDVITENLFEPIQECEWHTKDPLTGEVFFLSKGILYSKLPSKEKQKIFSINTSHDSKKMENSKKDNSVKKDNSIFFL